MATEEPALTMKEAVTEIRKDVKTILEVLPLKADRSDSVLLERRVETLEGDAARRKEIEDIVRRLGELEKNQAVAAGIDGFKKALLGIAVTVVITLFGLIGTIVIKLLPLNGPHKP